MEKEGLLGTETVASSNDLEANHPRTLQAARSRTNHLVTSRFEHCRDDPLSRSVRHDYRNSGMSGVSYVFLPPPPSSASSSSSLHSILDSSNGALSSPRICYPRIFHAPHHKYLQLFRRERGSCGLMPLPDAIIITSRHCLRWKKTRDGS